MRPGVLVISQDRLDGQVAGTSIRALELARAISASGANVTLAGVGEPPSTVAGLPCIGFDPQHPGAIADAIAGADVVVTLPQWPPLMRLLRRTRARVVFDLYVPQALETIGGFPGTRDRVRHALTEYAIDRSVEALRVGDYFICATEGQRDLYLGMMLAERLIDGARAAADPSLRSLIDVVPFGLPGEPAALTAGGGARDHFPAIGADDEIVLWNGGIWPWLDPATAIRAIGEIAARRPGVRLVFMGAASQVPAQRATESARAVAAELGLLDRNVFFNDAWVPYEQRANWLLEASCALYAHHDQLETRFAFRTRLLDAFWARLPVVCSTGDELADQIEAEGAGHTFAPEDHLAAAAAVERTLDAGRAAFAPGLERLAARHRWDTVAAPLVAYVHGGNASRAPRRTMRPGHAARHGGYVVLRKLLDGIGLRDRPRV